MAYGAGSLVELPRAADGTRRWRLYADAPRQPGQPRRRSTAVVHCRNQREAQTELRRHIERVSALDPATVRPGPGITVAAWLALWMSRLEAEGRTPNTIRGYRTKIDTLILPTLGNRRLDSIKPADLRSLYARLASSGGNGGGPLSPNSVRMAHAIIRKALGQAVLDEVLTSNPAERVKAPALPQQEVHPPATDVVRRLLDHADTRPSEGLWLHLHARTGARRGEICGLRWRDINLDAGELTIRTSVAVHAAAHVEGPTKTRSVRTIPLDDVLHARLTERRARVDRWAAQCESETNPDWWVLPQHDIPDSERPIPVASATAMFGRLCDDLDITGVRLHDLRHWFARQLLANGVDINTVARLLGHGNGTTTLRVYAHYHRPAGRSAVASIGAALA